MVEIHKVTYSICILVVKDNRMIVYTLSLDIPPAAIIVDINNYQLSTCTILITYPLIIGASLTPTLSNAITSSFLTQCGSNSDYTCSDSNNKLTERLYISLLYTYAKAYNFYSQCITL